MIKWLIAIVLLFILLIGGAVGVVFALGGPEEIVQRLKPEPQVTTVRLEQVHRGDLVRRVNAPGTIEPRTEVQISAQVSAKIIALPFKEGDHVMAEDVVARLDAEDVQASLDSTEAGLRSEEARLEGAEADLIEARLQFDRQVELLESRDVAQSAVDAARARYLRSKSNLKVIQSSIEMANARITQARKNLDNTVIRSPISGYITRLNIEVGEQVLGTFNNAGTVMMEIADMSEMIMHARVDEANISPVDVGQRAIVYLNAYGDEEFVGEVERVKMKKLIDQREGTNYFETEIVLHLSEGDPLRNTGLTANTDIEVETLYDVLKVPSQAVLDKRVEELPREIAESNPNVDEDRTFARVVFRFVDGKALLTPVRVGTSDLTHTVILAGLEPEDRVVVGPYKVLETLGHEQSVREWGTAEESDTPSPDEDADAGSESESSQDSETDEEATDPDGNPDADSTDAPAADPGS